MTRRYRSLRSRRGKAAAVELHHGAQVGRNDRNDVEDHVRRIVVAADEGLDDLEALHGLGALLALARGDDLAQLFSRGLEIDVTEQVAYGLGAHAAAEVIAIVRGAAHDRASRPR